MIKRQTLRKFFRQLNKSSKLSINFCTNKFKGCGNKGGTDRLPGHLEMALWAQAYLNIILQKPVSLQQVMECSLHQKLLALQKPFPEHFKDYQFDQKIKHEMRKFFLTNQGVFLPNDIYDQRRFRQAENKNGRVTFYPTYSTTRHMLRQILENTTLLVYGRWGIGKSLSLIICSMLYNIIYESHKRDRDLFQKYSDILKIFEVFYWSLNQRESDSSLKRKLLYQRRWLWPKLGIKFKNIEDLYQKIQKLPQKQNRQIWSKFKVFSLGQSKLIIDQINMLASLKRRYRQTAKLAQKKELQDKISNLDYLKGEFEQSTQILYSSSVNIQDNLTIFKFTAIDNLKLGSKQIPTSKQLFTIERPQINERVLDNDELAMVELSQFFTNILLQKQNTSKDKIKKAQRSFLEFEWSFLPNTLIIKREIQKYYKLKVDHKIWENIEKILEKIKSLAEANFSLKLSQYINKKKNQTQIQKNPKKDQQSALILRQAALQAKKLSKKDQSQKQKQKGGQAKEIQNKANQSTGKMFDLSKLSFQFKVQSEQQSADYDKHLFSCNQDPQKIRKKSGWKYIHTFRCLVSPHFFLGVFSFISKQGWPIALPIILKEQNVDMIKNILVTKSSDKLGTLFERCIVYLLQLSIFQIRFTINEKQSFKQSIDLTTNIHNIKAGMSLQNELMNAKKLLLQNNINQGILCIPHQFQGMVDKFKQMQRSNLAEIESIIEEDKKKPNPAFDLVLISKGPSLRNDYYFIDFTTSGSSKTILKKYKNFIKYLMSLQEFSSFKSQRTLSQKMLKKYFNNIRFVIFGLDGQNQGVDYNILPEGIQRDFAKYLMIPLFKLNYFKQCLIKNQRQQSFSAISVAKYATLIIDCVKQKLVKAKIKQQQQLEQEYKKNGKTKNQKLNQGQNVETKNGIESENESKNDSDSDSENEK